MSQCLAYDPSTKKANVWVRCQSNDAWWPSRYCPSHAAQIAVCTPIPVMAYPCEVPA